MKEILTVQEVNEYIAEQYADEIQDDEKREVATGMIDNAIVDYLCERDDLWTFIFYSQGERIESSHRSNDLSSAEEASTSLSKHILMLYSQDLKNFRKIINRCIYCIGFLFGIWSI